MGRKRVPLLTEEQVRELRTRDKIVDFDWHETLLAGLTDDGTGNDSSRVPLGPVNVPMLGLTGRFSVWARRSRRHPTESFTAGLGYRDADGHGYAIVRVNGPHGVHPNRHDDSVVVGPHVHYLTELYQRLGRGRSPSPDGFAIGGGTWTNLEEAVEALRPRARIKIEKQLELRRQEGGYR